MVEVSTILLYHGNQAKAPLKEASVLIQATASRRYVTAALVLIIGTSYLLPDASWPSRMLRSAQMMMHPQTLEVLQEPFESCADLFELDPFPDLPRCSVADVFSNTLHFMPRTYSTSNIWLVVTASTRSMQKALPHHGFYAQRSSFGIVEVCTHSLVALYQSSTSLTHHQQGFWKQASSPTLPYYVGSTNSRPTNSFFALSHTTFGDCV